MNPGETPVRAPGIASREAGVQRPTALVRPPSRAYARCIRKDPSRPIDVGRAQAQHTEYCAALAWAGCAVAWLAPEADLPDACFVEDTAVVVGDLAVMTRPGAPAREPEVPSVRAFLATRLRVVDMDRGHLDGGDVLVAGKTAFVGLSGRTDEEGARCLAERLAEVGIAVRTVRVAGLLHLKTGATPLDDRRILAREGAFPSGTFEGYEVVETDELYGSTVLAIGGRAIVSTAAPRTARRLEVEGLHVRPVDVTEFHAGDAGVTCLSIVLPPRW